MVLYLTHFNNFTYEENKRWREINNIITIYNSPIQLPSNINSQSKIYVIEMNNSTNQIEGVGIIKCKQRLDKKYKIYSEQNYNRYTYIGNKRIDRDSFDEETLKNLEYRLFIGKSDLKPTIRRGTHLKRGQGIKKVPQDIEFDYFNYIQTIFSFQE